MKLDDGLQGHDIILVPVDIVIKLLRRVCVHIFGQTLVVTFFTNPQALHPRRVTMDPAKLAKLQAAAAANRLGE